MADYTVTLAAEETTTPAFLREALYLVGFRFDDDFEGTSIGIEESQTETGTFRTYQWDGADWALDVAAGKCCGIDWATLEAAGPWIKIVSNAAQPAATPSVITPRYRDYGRG